MTTCLAAAILTVPAVRAHTDPPGAYGSYSPLAFLVAFRDPAGTIPVVGSVSACETIHFRASLSVPFPGTIGAAFEGGRWEVVLPDGSVVDITPPTGVPCIGGATNDPESAANDGRGLCEGSTGQIVSDLIPYTVHPADVSGGRIVASQFHGDPDPSSPSTAYLHLGESDLGGVSASSAILFVVLFCDDGDACTTDFCDPGAEQCAHSPIACDDANPCTDDTCDPASGCGFTNDDGNSCSDGSACTTDACVAGACVGTPVSCDDGDPCTDDSCDALIGCVHPSNDADADGVCGDADNCPGVPNPDRADEDSDGVGDPCDNCASSFNPGQHDRDSDLEGDVCDLDDGMILVRFSDAARLEWQQEAGSWSWNLYRGDLDVLKETGVYTQPPGSSPLADRRCGETLPWVTDLDGPPPGGTAFLLVTSVSGGVEGSLGTDGADNERPNANPCP